MRTGYLGTAIDGGDSDTLGERGDTPGPTVAPSLEVRIKPGEDAWHDTWTVEGRRGGELVYVRAWNASAEEAWMYGSDWLRGETGRPAR